MKVWELIKYVEEGGKIKHVGDGYGTMDMDWIVRNSFKNIVESPDKYEVVKSKKKIKLYRYTYQCDNRCVFDQSVWTSNDFKAWFDLYEETELYDNPILLKTEEKEIEIDDNNAE